MRVSAEEVFAQVHTWLPGSVYYLGIRFVCTFLQTAQAPQTDLYMNIFLSCMALLMTLTTEQ